MESVVVCLTNYSLQCVIVSINLQSRVSAEDTVLGKEATDNLKIDHSGNIKFKLP